LPHIYAIFSHKTLALPQLHGNANPPAEIEVINGASGDALELLCRAMESKLKE
jgi:hypothetical protein